MNAFLLLQGIETLSLRYVNRKGPAIRYRVCENRDHNIKRQQTGIQKRG
jgi:O-acetylhomoserine/O-acetylserine sulfhydrylase-like pyridoxal-dependent enzyme